MTTMSTAQAEVSGNGNDECQRHKNMQQRDDSVLPRVQPLARQRLLLHGIEQMHVFGSAEQQRIPDQEQQRVRGAT